MNTAAARRTASVPLPAAGIAALVLVTLASVAAVRWSGIGISEPDAAAIASRALRFDDRPDGSLEIFDAASGKLVHTVRGEAGFIRGTLRGLARERRRAGIGAAPPFELVARADGRLTLVDPSTGRRVDLESFGPTNATEFARLLGEASRSPP